MYEQCAFCKDICNEWYDAREIIPITLFRGRLGEWKMMCKDCFAQHGHNTDGVRFHHYHPEAATSI